MNNNPKNKLKALIQKYSQRLKSSLIASNIQYEITYPISVDNDEGAFLFIDQTVNQVRCHCQENNINLDKLVIMLSYDADLFDEDIEYKKLNMSGHSDSLFRVIKHDDNTVEGILFLGGYIEVDKEL